MFCSVGLSLRKSRGVSVALSYNLSTGDTQKAPRQSWWPWWCIASIICTPFGVWDDFYDIESLCTFIGHLSNSGDLLLRVGVRRRPSCVNIFSRTTGPNSTQSHVNSLFVKKMSYLFYCFIISNSLWSSSSSPRSRFLLRQLKEWVKHTLSSNQGFRRLPF